MNAKNTLLAALALPLCASAQEPEKPGVSSMDTRKTPVVFFTHDISPNGLTRAYKALGRPLEGRKVAVKISTGEAGNNHYLKPGLSPNFFRRHSAAH